MNATVAVAGPGDVADLIFLGRKTFIETYKGVGERPAGLEEAYGREAFNETVLLPQLSSRGPVFFLGRVDGAAAGFLKLDFGPVPACVPDKGAAQVAQIYVLKEFHGGGLGKKLLSAALEAAAERGRSSLWLEAWERNLTALEFHRRMGFSAVGKAPWVFKAAGYDYQDMDLVMHRPAKLAPEKLS